MKRRGIAMFLALCLSLSLVSGGAAAAGNNPFADVPSSHWANEAVNYVYGKGMMNGVGKDTFQPKGSLTRAMFVTILGRMAGVKENAYPGTSFGDVPVGQWYSPYVAWAAQTGVTGGTGGGKFSPTSAVTREQMATMIARYTESADLTLGESSDPAPSFTDQSAVASWAREGVDLMRRTGILTGYEDGSFQPQRTANRAEAAAIFMRLDQSAGGSAQAAYTVTFDTNGGSAVPSQTVKHGQTVQKPADPTRPGKRFQGWQSKGTGKAYDFKAPVTGNLTLVAVWAEDMGEDTLYELTDDRVVIDPVEQIPYVKDILLVFLKPGLSEGEKEQLAEQIGGTIAGDIAGDINILQISVKGNSLAEMEGMANALQKDDRVMYATCDYPVPAKSVTSMASGRAADSGDWWYSAVRADEAWKNYRACFGDITVGVIDNGVESQHPELSGSVTFASPYYQSYNDLLFPDEKNEKRLNHGTHVSGIIAAKEDGKGMTGVAPQADIVFASYTADNDPSWNTVLSEIHALKCEIEKGAKVINCSFGITYHDEAGYQEGKSSGALEFQYDTYLEFLRVRNRAVAERSKAIAAATCDLIRAGEEFLVVQAAGNGINSRGPGVDAWYSSYWAGCSKATVGDVCQKYNLSYDELDKRILVVSGVSKKKSGNAYVMDPALNYGEMVDICAPGQDIKSSIYNNEKGLKYSVESGTSMAAPIVTGTAALVWSANPDLKAEQVRDILLKNHRYVAKGVYVKEECKPMVDVYSAVRAAIGKNLRDLVGVYTGTYIDDQGEKGLTLRVYEENGTYRARFEFYGLPGQSDAPKGVYTMNVTMTGPSTFRFEADSWIEQPEGYPLLDLEGVLKGDTLAGTSPTQFSVTRTEQTETDAGWKQAYLDYIQKGAWQEDGGYWSDEIAEKSTYYLIDVNGDVVPELWIDNSYTYAGDRLCTYKNGKVAVLVANFSKGMKYLPGENLIMTQIMHQGRFMDWIDRIENGQFVQVARGDYQMVYEDHTSGKYYYEYYWNGMPEDEMTYKQKLNEVFDCQRSVDPQKSGTGLSYQKIQAELSA